MGYKPPPYRIVHGIKVFEPCGRCGEDGYFNEHGVCRNCDNPCTKCGKRPCAGTLVMCGECVAGEMRRG